MTDARLSWAEPGDSGVLHVRGDCTMPHVSGLLAEIAGLKRTPDGLDLAAIEALDSAGALVLLRLLDPSLAIGASCYSRLLRRKSK